ncbi:aminotransferase class IV [bacterium]|nr:aminotransferase class IV [bacterium]
MEQVINIDGKLLPAAEARISVFDRGFLFGDSIYETLRTYGGKPFLMDRHLQRLVNSANMLFMELPVDLQEFSRQVSRTVEASSNVECYIRIIVTRGAGRIGLDVNLSKQPSYVIIVIPLEPPSPQFYETGIKVSVVSVRRNDITTLNPKIKSSNLLNNVLAYVQAKKEGSFEGILCNMAGNVAEGTGSNIFIVQNGKLKTPPPEAGLLEGVTRALTLDLAAAENVPFEEAHFTPRELLQGDECFITSTTKEILPVRQVDGKEFSVVPGPVTKRLMHAYKKFVKHQQIG